MRENVVSAFESCEGDLIWHLLLELELANLERQTQLRWTRS